MNIRSFLIGCLVISTLTAVSQEKSGKNNNLKTNKSASERNKPTGDVNRQDRPHPTKPAQFVSEWMNPSGELTFKELPYAYDALEKAIDAKTVEVHYDKHHRGYYTNFMNAIKGTDMEKMPITMIFANIKGQPDAVRNNAGGYFNHVIYWQNMSPDGGGEPSGELMQEINKTFGNFKNFKDKFEEAGKSRFGSGWAWLAVDMKTGELFITSTANQDNPLMNITDRRGIPILGMDVWEHAYYLKYQNKRADYITAFWNVVNWGDVEAKYKGYRSMREDNNNTK